MQVAAIFCAPTTLPDAVHLGMADDVSAPEGASADGADRPTPGRITRVILKNYKSIVSCDVELQPLTILVGPNGSGKSNFLDALSFVKDALTVGLERAIRNRGNLDRILSAARPPDESWFSIHLEFQLSSGARGDYTLKIGATTDDGFVVRREMLIVDNGWALPTSAYMYDLGAEAKPDVWAAIQYAPFRRANRLYLANFPEAVEAGPVYDLLTRMAFYNPLPDQMRSPVDQSAEPHLLPDGRNIASMLRRMQVNDPEQIWGITQYMKRVLPGLEEIKSTAFQGFDYLSFSTQSDNEGSTAEFVASQMSDGTLRALAVLVALFQGRMGGKSATSLVGIEEPENNLHPATGGAFADALMDAAYDGQVLVATHSTSLLDGNEIPITCVLAVSSEQGITRIGPIDEVSQSVVRDGLYTVGQMLQMDQLRPETATSPDNGDTALAPTVAGS